MSKDDLPMSCISWYSRCISFFFKKINLFILFSLLLAALGLCCCARVFSSRGEWGLLFLVVRGLLIVVASFVVEHRL